MDDLELPEIGGRPKRRRRKLDKLFYFVSVYICPYSCVVTSPVYAADKNRHTKQAKPTKPKVRSKDTYYETFSSPPICGAIVFC